MKKICIIPIRSGSKRLTDKNILEYHGKSLYEWTTDFSLKSNFFNKIILATNYENILNKKFNKKIIKYSRSKKNSSDRSTLLDLTKEIIVKFNIKNDDIIFILPVTNPLRRKKDLIKIYNLFEKNKFKYPVFSVRKNINPLHLLFKKEKGFLKPFKKNVINTKKQASPTNYIWNDAFLIDSCKNFMQKKNLYGYKCLFYEMPQEFSVSIDDKYDFEVSKFFFKKILGT
tara:strand:- start:5515 stop:6198 length:684 start_codon:yes stop_codon:yes gene_type:complete